MRSLVLLTLTVVAAVLGSAPEVNHSYAGYKVFSVAPATRDQVHKLKQWEFGAEVDFWEQPIVGGTPARVMISPDLMQPFMAMLDSEEIQHTLVINDVEPTLLRERKEQALNRVQRMMRTGSRHTVDFDHFWTYEEIYAYLDEIAAEFPNIVKIETVGMSYEKRPIKAVKISTNGAGFGSRPMVFIDAGIHAREWAAQVAAVYLIHEIVEHPEDHKDMLDNTDWFIIPIANPDGYVFTHTTDRFWRKTRQPNAGSACVGVDPNRNYNFQWDVPNGASTNPCSLNFRGTSPNTESEVVTVSEQVVKYASKTKLYLSLHSYGNYLLYPWGYAEILIDNHAEHKSMGDSAAAAIKAVKGTKYTVGNGAIALYPASGASDDFAAGVAKIPFSFTVELPGGGSQGFDLPASEIKGMVTETFAGFAVFGKYVGSSL